MSWIGANLGTLGQMGDAALANSCVPYPFNLNPNRVICGGIVFTERAFAATWPGDPLLEDYPTVHSVAQGHDLLPPMQYGLESRLTPLRDAIPATSPNEAARTGRDMGPVTLVAPMPSITPPRQNQTSSEDMGFFCQMNNWAVRNPLLALGAAGLLFVALKGGKR